MTCEAISYKYDKWIKNPQLAIDISYKDEQYKNWDIFFDYLNNGGILGVSIKHQKSNDIWYIMSKNKENEPGNFIELAHKEIDRRQVQRVNKLKKKKQRIYEFKY